MKTAHYEFDKEAIANAKQQLGIELPVIIRFRDTRTPRTGRGQERVGFQMSHDNQRHLIHVLIDRPIEEINETIWHELVHCMQAEKFVRENHHEVTISEFDSLYARENTVASYLYNRFEIEARVLSAANKHKVLLHEQVMP